MSRLLRIISLIMMISMLGGCNHYLDTLGLHDETIYPSALPIDNPPPPKQNGSIYQAGHEISLYNDHIAGRIGDILTVRLEEVTQGEKKAKTKTSKVATNNFAKPTLLGGAINALTFNTATDIEFNGDGESNQQNRLKGTISVTVTRVLSNYNLIVQGESWVTIDQGREYIRLTGIVRPEDIEPTNTISSQRVAGARITYSGNGQVANNSRGGILTQFFTKFFPY
ncbi:MAG: flagellar basal body L-ring protein FlgH [Gammaproteobacteria bacterium]|nr:flagellar basal body L-ring protein FlgH [Gammaproteobacteria bacterium]